MRREMTIKMRELGYGDLPPFIKMRLAQLQEEGAVSANDLSPNLLAYYTKHLEDGSFFSWLAIDHNNQIIATSGLSIVERPPYYQNTNGKVGILSSMYTVAAHRRQGIAKQLLKKLMESAKKVDCQVIQITASDMGVFLYTDFGFKKNDNFMQYKV